MFTTNTNNNIGANSNIFQNQIKLSDSNKENWTPSSYMNSNRQSMNVNNFQENGLKMLRDRKDNTLSTMESNESKYFALLKEKEDLSSQVIQKDSLLFKEKADLEFLSNLLKEKEAKRNSALEASVNCDHIWMENEFLSANLFSFEQKKSTNNNMDAPLSGNKVLVRMKNELAFVGIKEKDGISLSGIIRTDTNTGINSGNGNASDVYEKSYNMDPRGMQYFAAFNIY